MRQTDWDSREIYTIDDRDEGLGPNLDRVALFSNTLARRSCTDNCHYHSRYIVQRVRPLFALAVLRPPSYDYPKSAIFGCRGQRSNRAVHN